MVMINLEIDTLAVLIAGLYSIDTGVDAHAIPRSVWLEVAEKIEEYIDKWDFSIISLENWIKYCLIIYPINQMGVEEIETLQKSNLCWTRSNGNVELFISMDMDFATGEGDV